MGNTFSGCSTKILAMAVQRGSWFGLFWPSSTNTLLAATKTVTRAMIMRLEVVASWKCPFSLKFALTSMWLYLHFD